MPKTLEERKQRCQEWMHRPSPLSSPTTSDAEDDGDELYGASAKAVAETVGLKEDALETGGDDEMDIDNMDAWEEQMC